MGKEGENGERNKQEKEMTDEKEIVERVEEEKW